VLKRREGRGGTERSKRSQTLIFTTDERKKKILSKKSGLPRLGCRRGKGRGRFEGKVQKGTIRTSKISSKKNKRGGEVEILFRYA